MQAAQHNGRAASERPTPMGTMTSVESNMDTEPTQADLFVAAWLKAHKAGKTIHDVAGALSITPEYAHVSASRLRAKGVKLPKLKPVKRAVVDVRALNKLIRGGK